MLKNTFNFEMVPFFYAYIWVNVKTHKSMKKRESEDIIDITLPETLMYCTVQKNKAF